MSFIFLSAIDLRSSFIHPIPHAFFYFQLTTYKFPQSRQTEDEDNGFAIFKNNDKLINLFLDFKWPKENAQQLHRLKKKLFLKRRNLTTPIQKLKQPTMRTSKSQNQLKPEVKKLQ